MMDVKSEDYSMPTRQQFVEHFKQKIEAIQEASAALRELPLTMQRLQEAEKLLLLLSDYLIAGFGVVEEVAAAEKSVGAPEKHRFDEVYDAIKPLTFSGDDLEEHHS